MKHLLRCRKFLTSSTGRDLAKTVPDVAVAAAQLGIPIPGGAGGGPSVPKKRRAELQRSIYESADSIEPEEMRRLQRLLAKALYCKAQPLSTFEHPAWVEFFRELRPAFKLPSR